MAIVFRNFKEGGGYRVRGANERIDIIIRKIYRLPKGQREADVEIRANGSLKKVSLNEREDYELENLRVGLVYRDRLGNAVRMYCITPRGYNVRPLFHPNR